VSIVSIRVSIISSRASGVSGGLPGHALRTASSALAAIALSSSKAARCASVGLTARSVDVERPEAHAHGLADRHEHCASPDCPWLRHRLNKAAQHSSSRLFSRVDVGQTCASAVHYE
jgi:hypothetical protein